MTFCVIIIHDDLSWTYVARGLRLLDACVVHAQASSIGTTEVIAE